MAIGSLLPVFLFISVCSAWNEERPILETRDGNLVIASAKDRNITLLTSGKSTINVNDINLFEVAEHARKAAGVVSNWENGYLNDLTTQVNQLVNAVEGRPNGLEYRLNEIQSRFYNTTNSGTFNGNQSESYIVPRLALRMRRLELTVARIRNKLEINSCLDDPCQNGGTCIRIYGGVQCLCPSNYEGPNCADDVNECARYADTDLGCQNGATCRNLRGSYRCDCAPGWHGVHCITKSNVCDPQDSRDLCGHGVCVPKKDSSIGYSCVCEQGWQKDGSDPACTKDVDECAGKHPPCSTNPAVACINLDGGYDCGPCGAGFTGSGFYCNDIDECAVDNGGCSTEPKVQCINTVGSRICGLCPPGWEGDGKTCTQVGGCRINNGGCHPHARCVENSGYTNLFVQCNCPIGYHGDGIGPNGCQFGSDFISPCSSNPCVHGTCEPNGALFRCRCNPGFTGTQCDTQANPCTPNPCQNGGICQSSDFQSVTCNCTEKYSGPRCENQRQSCGGYFTNPSGTVVFPVDGEIYEPDLSCAFIINPTNESIVLNITFTRFDFEDSPDCHHDFLQIHDGATAGTHQKGRFCGSRFPLGGTFTTNHNAVYLWLRSDRSHGHHGFALTWNSVVPSCGGTLNEPHGSITSPGWGGQYPHNRDCLWEISVKPGKRIQFHFLTVMIEEHPTCDYDYLAINETLSNREVRLDLYCNHTTPGPLFTSGSFAKIYFHSDDSGSDLGFQLSYSTVEGTPGCGGVLTADHGFITSPGYPSNYPATMICDWRIQLPKGERIRLTWIAFELEDTRRCRWDSVQVFSGPDTESPVVGRFCGSTLPESRSLNTNVALVVFTSDYTHERKGFKLKYETICGGEFYESSGVIKSPYYPSNYPESRICIYQIIQPPGKSIILTMVDTEIAGVRNSCFLSGLSIYDGDNDNSTLLGKICGSHGTRPSLPYISTHNIMYMKFDTFRNIDNRGFMANYTTFDRRCGGIFKDPSGVIQSHKVGENYGNFENCLWILRAPKGHVVQLSFSTFHLEQSVHCQRDYIALYDGAKVEGREMGRFCGSERPKIPLMTQGETMTVVFRSDRSVAYEGFIAHYMFVDASKVCGANFFTSTGSILSPNYPNNYPSNRECVWIITAPNKQQINLEVEKFDLEKSVNCDYDYLEVRNGGYENSPLINRYCGTDIPRNFRSLTNHMYLKFVTDRWTSNGGFSIKWDSSTFGCGGTLTGFRGEIMSPNYPQQYPRVADCEWKIIVASGNKIRIIIVDLDLENRRGCWFDYIAIMTGVEDYKRTSTRYCSSNHPSFIDVDSNQATILFRSDYSDSGRGFHIKYETICVGTVRGFSGVIESPNFPNKYPDSLNCTWIIEAPLGNKVNISFSHFDVKLTDASSKNCSDDYLAIQEGSGNEADTEIVTLCGSDKLPAPISSKQNQVFLHFVTDHYYKSYDGFRLEWSTYGCGGHLTRPSGTIMSPRYPNAYPESIECEWLIEVEYGHSVEITFLDVSTEKVSGCIYDKISLYGGADTNAPKLTELCHTDGHTKWTSPTNKLFVKFMSDASFAGRGFKAEYKSVPLTCGGVFRAEQGVIHTANYPNNYPNNENCEWLIEVPKNYVVNLTFTEFDIEDSTNCTDDYVKIFDGTTRNDELYGPYCKTNRPESIISKGNSLLVVLRSDSVVTSKGFQAQFTKTCGARLIANGTGTLEISAISISDFRINCTWIIVAEDPADHITLSFFHLDLGNSNTADEDCFSHYVRVYEGDGFHGPARGTWCTSKTPPPIISTGNALTVNLYEQWGNQNRFGATYSVLNSACGGDYHSASGVIASPTYPNSYPTNAECVWLLKVSPGNRMSLIFTAFGLESSPNCDRDYLEIREASGVGKLIGTFCADMPNPIESSTSLWIKFRSDAIGTAKGFMAEYALIRGNELTGINGEIATPLWPYSWNEDEEITWRITVDFGMAIRIEFDEIHMEDFGGCASGVTTYDGYDAEAPKLSTDCGLSVPEKPIVSSSNVVFITFSGIYYREGNWFHLHWYQVPRDQKNSANTVTTISDCVVEYDMTSAENRTVIFTSPGWPDGYADDLDCTWVFMSPPGYHFVMQFLAMHLEETSPCSTDYVSVYNGNGLAAPLDDSQVLRRACWSNETSKEIVGNNIMTVKFRSDFSVNETGFRAMVTRECGGELSGPDGIIDFNDTMDMHNPRNYRYNCEWNITVKTGRTIVIEFTDFVAENKERAGCESNYVLLKNGVGREAPLLHSGKFCATNKPPDSLETTGNRLYFKATGLRNQINFKMTYREKGMACGGNVRFSNADQTHGFNTPNYPNIPPPYSECFWTFMAPAGEKLSIHFVGRFDLTLSRDCTKEYVEIRDGGTENSRFIGRFCGDTPPASTETTGNMLYVHFYSETHDPKNGFKATVTKGLCGGILRGKNGVISSPKYPGVYPINQRCSWSIIGPEDHTLKIAFTDIDLPDTRRCSSDYVSIVEPLLSNNSSDTSVEPVNSFGSWCGTMNPIAIETSSNEATVTFTSDNRTGIGYRGFKLNFTASHEACGGSLTGMSGVFQTTGFPIPSLHPRVCDWTIEGPEGSQVVVQIMDVDMPAESDDRMMGSYLVFWNDKKYRSRIINRPKHTDRIASTSNTMRIRFRFGSGRRGLTARFFSVSPAPCGGSVSDVKGALLPPFAPFNAASFFCQWKLRPPEAMIDPRNRTGITLTVTVSGSIGGHASLTKNCENRWKYISIGDGEQQVDAVCGNITGEPYVFRSLMPLNTIDVLNGTYLGPINFDLRYEWTACGGVLTGPSHTISSPSNVTYPKSCVWYAKYDDPGAVISMTFNRMNLGSCDKGYLIVRNGGRMSPEVGKFCGNIKRRNITSSSNELWIEYWAAEAPGDFEIQLDLPSGSCGGVFRGYNKVITSPDFPKQYPNDAECTWEITADPGYTVGLVFVDRFSMETSNDCANDFVQISDWTYDSHGIGAWKDGPKYCGRNTPNPINATTNRMKVLFRSNNDLQGDGFRAIWEQNCGGIFEATSNAQYISSPMYPRAYPSNIKCNYTITAPKNKKIWIEFMDFKMEGMRNHKCLFDNVAISSHILYDHTDVWCGDEIPPTTGSIETMNIVFVSDPFVELRGFLFKYFTNDCGGVITEPTQISPPSTKTGSYFGHLNCTWVITAPEDKSVVLRLEKFHLEWATRCQYDQLLAVEGDTLEGPNIITLCGNLTGAEASAIPIHSAGNKMTVMFKSDISNEYGGMKATILFVKSVASGCGGNVDLQSSKPFTTQTGAMYEALEDCHWTVTAEVGKNVKFTINRIDLKNATNFTRADGSCSGDFLEVRDGGPVGELLDRYCGNVKPQQPITSTTNVLWIRFFTDSTLEGEGVSGTLEPIDSPCGKNMWDIDNTTKIFASPGYPADFPAGTRCRWQFTNTDQYSSLRLHFENLDMEDAENCNGDYLEITDDDEKRILQDFGENFIFNGKKSRPHNYAMGRFHRVVSYKYCGQASAIDYHSYSQNIHVLLKSTPDNMPKPRKFKFEVAQASCNRNYTAEQGRVMHHNVDDCWTTITAPPNHTISLYFMHFMFYDHNNCSENYFQVHYGDFKSPVVHTLCGLTEPNPIFSTGNKLSIHARSNHLFTYGVQSYDVLYTTTDRGRGCGGKLYNYGGIFTSPMYPHNYRNDSTCEWEISVPRDYKVALEFALFDLGTSDICDTDYLLIRERNKDGVPDKTFCPGQTPAPVRSSTNTINVIYVSSVNSGGTGWLIRFSAVQGTTSEDRHPSLW